MAWGLGGWFRPDLLQPRDEARNDLALAGLEVYHDNSYRCLIVDAVKLYGLSHRSALPVKSICSLFSLFKRAMFVTS